MWGHCYSSFSSKEEYMVHFRSAHYSEIRELYLTLNLTRLELAAHYNVNDSRMKLILNYLSLKKPRSLSQINTWKSSDKSVRVKNATAARTYDEPAFLEASKNNLLKARESQELKASSKAHERLNLIREGYSLEFSVLNRNAYRSWRSENNMNYCDICKSTSPKRNTDFLVDHCHKSLFIRGLLCYQCNNFLGWVDKYRSNIDTYLEKPKLSFYYTKALAGTLTFPMGKGDVQICGICFKVGIMGIYNHVVDHDHSSNLVRGVLCTYCNTRLGKFEKWQPYDYIDKERKAIERIHE